MSSDVNLLFAVLALQADLLDQARFVEACTLWASRKDTPLADLLVERGWLSAEDTADVQKLLERKLRKHHGDARASLAEVADEGVRRSLAGIADADVQQSLGPPTPEAPSDGSTTAHVPEGRGRYTLLHIHAQGGIGQVWLAHDSDLNRDVALKELRPERDGHPAVRARFLEEARVTGQLEHPGIVPVYELVRDGEAPAYAMRMVRGRTLGEALKEYHRRRLAGEAGPLDLRSLLTAFVSVCNAVGYAHSRGVLHRDLKPANVVLGDFGEVVVLDWGLARLMGHAGPEEATALAPVSLEPGSRDETAQGQVLGTPAYMAPEQAEGRVDLLGPATDVYGLGAVLYEVLTGTPPFTGQRDELVRRVARLEPERPRQLVPEVPKALEAVCLKALAKKPADRYATAGEVAREVERWLADEPVAAYREPLRVRAGRWVRRHQALTAASAAGVLVALLLGGAGALWAEGQRGQRQAEEALRRQEADAAASSAMGQARLLLEQARKETLGDAGRFREALAAAELARELARTGGASGEVEAEATALAGTLKQEAEAAARDRALLGALLEIHGPQEGPKYQRDDKGHMLAMAERPADEQYRDAFRSWGLDVDATPAAEAAAKLRARPAAVVVEVVAALDAWADERRSQKRPKAERNRLMSLAQALDDGPGSKNRELRALLAGGDLGRERALGMLSMALRPVPVPFDAGWGVDRGRLRALAASADPEKEPVLGLLMLSRALWVAGDDGLAVRLLQAAVRSRPREVVLHNALANLHRWGRRWREAAEGYAAVRALRPDSGGFLAWALVKAGRVEEGLALFGRLRVERPGDPWLHNAHGAALCDDCGRPKEAEAAFREAIRLRPDYPEAHVNLGISLDRQGRHREAEAAYREAIRLKGDLAEAHLNLGSALNSQGRHREAEAACREALRLRPDYPKVYYGLGNALYFQGRSEEEEAAFREAIRLRPDYPEVHVNLGNALDRQGRSKEAEAAYREAIRLKGDLAEAHLNLGSALNSQGRHREAEAACREAIRLRPDYPVAHFGLGNALSSQGRPKEAEAAFREAIRLRPDYPEAHVNLGNALNRQGRHREAEAAFREAIRLRPVLPEAHNGLGNALNRQGRCREAEAACREALRLRPDYPEAHNNLGNALSSQGRPKEEEAAFREAIRLRPDYPEAHVNLGNALRDQGRFLDALETMRIGHGLGSKRPGWPYPSAAWVRECERLVELDRLLSRKLRGEGEPANAADLLELVKMCQHPNRGLHAAAARLAAEAFAAQPSLARNVVRYDAACSAALASAGQAADASRLPDKVSNALRDQALKWLRAELAHQASFAEQGDAPTKAAVGAWMRHWLKDPDFVSVRDPAALRKLPEAERREWQGFWSEVASLLKKASP
jgi:tetratricopeptide (TPR) repeat protein